MEASMHGLIDWQTLSGWWEGMDTPIQVTLFGVTLYTTGMGMLRVGIQMFRAICRVQAWVRAWWSRPSRLDVVESKLADLLVKLGEKPERLAEYQ
jgi:hypothetical protein